MNSQKPMKIMQRGHQSECDYCWKLTGAKCNPGMTFSEVNGEEGDQSLDVIIPSHTQVERSFKVQLIH